MGLFDKKMIVELDKKNYCPGQNITGRVILNLDKPVKGNFLSVKFKGTKQVRTRSLSSYDSTTPSSVDYDYETIVLYEDGKILSGENEFFSLTYPFNIPIPIEIEKKLPMSPLTASRREYKKMGLNPDGKITKYLVKARTIERKMKSNSIKWFIESELDIPNWLDLKKIVYIKIKKNI